MKSLLKDESGHGPIMDRQGVIIIGIGCVIILGVLCMAGFGIYHLFAC